MDIKEFSNLMIEYGKEINIVFTEEQLQKFYEYMNLLIEWNEKINLTAIVEPKEIILKHFIDSLTIIKYIDQNIDITDYQNPVDTNIGKEGIIDNMMLAEAVLLDVDEGLPKVIIPKKTVVPYSGAIRGAFRTTSPAGVKLNIYAAEDAYDSSMRVQKSLEKEFEFPVPSGTPFDIEYHINENKAISMKIIIDDGIREKQELELSIYSDINVTKHDYSIRIED